MVGAGAVVFAVMGYVIAKQEPSRSLGSQVRLNPILLATILGEDEKDVVRAIDKLCGPDPRSTTKTEDGRRLKKIGEFDYQVINGAKYRAIRDEETRLEQNRVAQRTFRSKKRHPVKGEAAAVKALENGNDETYDEIEKSSLPEQCR